MKRLILRLLITATIGIVGYLLLWPVPIDPIAWDPPPAPELTGVYAQNNELAKTQRIPVNHQAPEDIAFDKQDRIYTGADDGYIYRLQADGTRPEVFTRTYGRPLGLAFDQNGNLIVADADKGLLSVAPDGSIRLLSNQSDGVAFRCTNDLDIAADGTIYFTDASYKYPLKELRSDVFEHRPNGRLLAFDPKTGQTRTVLRDLYFANGVAVSPDQSFVLVCETETYAIKRVWLKGEKQGQAETFIDNLPGLPDGIMSNGRDTFWLALVNRRDAKLDALLPRPFLRKVVTRLPNFLQPNLARYGFVIGLDMNGKVIRNLQDPAPECFTQIANVVEHKGSLYFGSIGENSVGRFPLAP
jgi:sugar lactone lactonase YvrE